MQGFRKNGKVLSGVEADMHAEDWARLLAPLGRDKFRTRVLSPRCAGASGWTHGFEVGAAQTPVPAASRDPMQLNNLSARLL